MRGTLSFNMLNALSHGKAQLSEEAQRRIQAYIRSQQLEDGSFMDKNDCPDVYYTAFGWLLCYVFGLPLPHAAARNYLNTLNSSRPETVDLVHYAANIRCRLLYRLLAQPTVLSNLLLFSRLQRAPYVSQFARFLMQLFSTPITLETVSTYPHNDPEAPYSQFIRLSLLEDAGKQIPNPKEWLQTLRGYRTPNGGYSNQKGSNSTTVNATAAALCVLGQLNSDEAGATADFLLKQQHTSGGFAASADAPLLDLLSTATALFALHANGRKPNPAARDFVEAHWNEVTGGFSATLFDETSDIEYTFYGLLALGTL